jgi:NADH-quinone oxidoreductase subunit N
VIVMMFFSDPAPDGPSVASPGLFTGAAVAIGALTTLVFGVIPQPLLNLASQAANHLFVS